MTIIKSGIKTSTKTKTITTGKQLIQGPAGKLEVAVDPVEEGVEERRAFGIVCHPHPLYGGTMQNKVVTTLAKAFQFLGLTTVRFNFRGVGKSEGEFNFGNGEFDDLLAVIEWVHGEQKQQKDNPLEIWLAGFSFGAYIAAKAATTLSIKKLVLVAPPVQNFPMQSLPPILCPWILVQGEMDDVALPKDVFLWAESRYPAPIILKFPQAGHFFHGQLIELRTRLEEALK